MGCTVWNTTKYCKWFIVLLVLFFKDTKNVITMHITADNWKCPPLLGLFKECWPSIHFRDTVHYLRIWQMQRFFMQCMWVFSTPYSTLLTVNVSTQVGLCFMCKETNCAIHKSLLLKKKTCCQLQNNHATGSQRNCSKAVNLCHTTQKMLDMSTALGGGGLQLLVYLLQYLEMYVVWLVSCTVRTVEQEVCETHYHLKLWALYLFLPHMCTACLLT